MNYLFKTSWRKNTSALLLLFVLLLMGNTSMAQAPGFLGKRLLIGVEVPMWASFGIFGDPYKYYEWNDKSGYVTEISSDESSFTLRKKPTVTVEYIFNRKFSIQGLVRYFQPMINIGSFSQTINDGFNTQHFTFQPTAKAKMRSLSLGAKFKFASKENVNPVGPYKYFGFEYSTQTILYDNDHFISTIGNAPVYQTPEQETTSNLVCIFGLGKQTVITNSSLLNIGVDLGLPLTNYWRVRKDDYPTEANYNAYTSAQALGGYVLINFNVGYVFGL